MWPRLSVSIFYVYSKLPALHRACSTHPTSQAGEIDGQAHCFVLSCARPDGNASKIGDQYEFACRSEHHLQVWTEAIAGELGAAAQQEKEFKKAAKAAHRLEKALKSAQKEMKKEHKQKKRTASDPPAAGAAVAAAGVAKAEPVAVTVKPALNRTNTFREVNLPSFDTPASPHAAAKASSAPHPPPSPSFAAATVPAPAPTAAHRHSSSASDTASPSSPSASSSSSSSAAHLNSHLASMLQSRQQARDDHDSEVARRQQRRLRQMAQDELIRARADAEQAELRCALSWISQMRSINCFQTKATFEAKRSLSRNKSQSDWGISSSELCDQASSSPMIYASR